MAAECRERHKHASVYVAAARQENDYLSFWLPAFLFCMKDFAKSFYRSKAWQAVRENVMQRDGRLCVDCLKAGLYTPAEEVHHITELTPENINDPAISLNMDNLVSLCRECHQKRHGAHQRRYKVDEYGRVVTH